MKLILSFVFLVVAATQQLFVTSNTVCPGARESSYGKGVLSCDPPQCSEGGDFYTSPDPTKYFVCADQDWSIVRPCASGTCFSAKMKGCVHPRDWTDDCLRVEETTPLPGPRLYDCSPKCTAEKIGEYYPTTTKNRWMFCEEIGDKFTTGECMMFFYFTIIDGEPSCVKGSEWVNVCKP